MQPSTPQIKNAIASPTIREAALDIMQRGALGESAFWERIAARGTPLQEPTNSPDEIFVTFLHRGDAATQHVVVLGGATEWRLAESKMERIPNSDIWFYSRVYPSNYVGSYRLCPNDTLLPFAEEKDWTVRQSKWLTDSLNPVVLDFNVPGEPRDSNPASVLTLPKAPQALACRLRPDIKHGALTKLEFKSEILGNARPVWIYTPPEYTPADDKYGAMLVFDGSCYVTAIPTPTILDNLIADGKIPPMIGIFIDSLSQDARNKELPCNADFIRSLSDELLPWVRVQFAVSEDPTRMIAAGSSYGGLAALFFALKRPDVCANVLSQSGGFWGSPGNEWRAWPCATDG